MMDPTQNLGTSFLIVAIVLGALATFFVITRIIVRLTLLKQFGADDYAIALAGVCPRFAHHECLHPRILPPARAQC
jgi:hypothetical protein